MSGKFPIRKNVLLAALSLLAAMIPYPSAADDFANSPFYSDQKSDINDRTSDSLDGLPESEKLFFLALRRLSESYNKAKSQLVASLRHTGQVDIDYANYSRAAATFREGLGRVVTSSSVPQHFKVGLMQAVEDEQSYFERAVAECKSGTSFEDTLKGEDVTAVRARLSGLANLTSSKMTGRTRDTVMKILRCFDPQSTI